MCSVGYLRDILLGRRKSKGDLVIMIKRRSGRIGVLRGFGGLMLGGGGLLLSGMARRRGLLSTPLSPTTKQQHHKKPVTVMEQGGLGSYQWKSVIGQTCRVGRLRGTTSVSRRMYSCRCGLPFWIGGIWLPRGSIVVDRFPRLGYRICCLLLFLSLFRMLDLSPLLLRCPSSPSRLI